MIDSHCHLADPAFSDDLAAVLQRARTVGVDRVITIADSLPESEKCVALAEEHAELYATVGVHPHHAKDWTDESERRTLSLVTASKKVRAVGEIGLDYHYDFSPRDTQQDVFRAQLRFAGCEGLPCVVHNRDSIKDLQRIIEEENAKKFVLHCCTEKWEDVRWIIERGSLLSFTGIATYPKSGDIRATIKNCPLEQMMIETDAPYLAPVPHRGKRNEPAFVVEVAKVIAEVKGLSLEEVDAATTRNAVEFFGLPS